MICLRPLFYISKNIRRRQTNRKRFFKTSIRRCQIHEPFLIFCCQSRTSSGQVDILELVSRLVFHTFQLQQEEPLFQCLVRPRNEPRDLRLRCDCLSSRNLGHECKALHLPDKCKWKSAGWKPWLGIKSASYLKFCLNSSI